MAIKGITIQLVKKTADGKDSLNRTTYKEDFINVSNVLVGEPSTSEITDTINLYGKVIAYTLAIPKGDDNDWVDTDVILPAPFEGRYRTIGFPMAGIEENIPLMWNKKVKLERYA